MSAITSPASVTTGRRPRLRVVPLHPPAPRCPRCRQELDQWDLELARIDRRASSCRTCGAVLL